MSLHLYCSPWVRCSHSLDRWVRETEARPVALDSRRPTRRMPDGPCPDRIRGKRNWSARVWESRGGAVGPSFRKRQWWYSAVRGLVRQSMMLLRHESLEIIGPMAFPLFFKDWLTPLLQVQHCPPRKPPPLVRGQSRPNSLTKAVSTCISGFVVPNRPTNWRGARTRSMQNAERHAHCSHTSVVKPHSVRDL